MVELELDLKEDGVGVPPPWVLESEVGSGVFGFCRETTGLTTDFTVFLSRAAAQLHSGNRSKIKNMSRKSN